MEKTKDGRMWSLMIRYISNELSLSETDELLQWLSGGQERSELLKDLRETWDKSRDFEVPRFGNPQLAWNSLRISLEKNSQPPRRSIFFRYRKFALVLLVCILACTASFFVMRSMRSAYSVKTGANENMEIVLPDGSFVWLDESSGLHYTTALFDKLNREVELNGSAYFEVSSKQKKVFVVLSENAFAECAEASFFIEKIKGNEVRITVRRGKLTLGWRSKPEQRQELQALDEGIIYEDGSIGKMQLDSYPKDKIRKKQ